MIAVEKRSFKTFNKKESIFEGFVVTRNSFLLAMGNLLAATAATWLQAIKSFLKHKLVSFFNKFIRLNRNDSPLVAGQGDSV